MHVCSRGSTSASTDNHSTALLRNATLRVPNNGAGNSDPPRLSTRLQVLVLAYVQDPGLCVRMPHAGCPPDTMLDCQVSLSIGLHLSHSAHSNASVSRSLEVAHQLSRQGLIFFRVRCVFLRVSPSHLLMNSLCGQHDLGCYICWTRSVTPEREREMLPTSSQKGLPRVGHERPVNTNSCATQPTNKRRVHESCIEGIKHRRGVKRPKLPDKERQAKLI